MYTAGFFISLFGLASWFYFAKDRKLSSLLNKVVGIGLIVYLAGVFFSPAAMDDKAFTLFRDFLVIGGIAASFHFFTSKNKALVPVFAIIVIVMGYFYNDQVLSHSLMNSAQTSSTINGLSEADDAPLSTTKFDKSSKLDTQAELLVEVKNGHSFSELEYLVDKHSLNFTRAFFPKSADKTDLDDYFLVNIPDEAIGKMDAIASDFQNSGLIDYLEPNETILLDDPTTIVAPSRRKINFGINDPGVNQLWGFEEMGVHKLYELLAQQKLKPKKKARIAILDTGVDSGHEDLKDNYKSIQKKYDIDTHSHGTHCAGIAAAVSNNGKGVASFSKDNSYVEVSSVKVLGGMGGGGTQAGIIKGMIEAADTGVDVISMSLGGRANPSRQKAYKDAVDYCNKKGAIVVVAAGNSNADAMKHSPANVDGVITVSAVDTMLNRASFSNHITNLKMGIAAPGVSIYSTIPGNKYQAMNGTSMATPYVAGLVGLMKSFNPKLTTKQVHKILKNTGIKTKDNEATGPMINPAEAIKKVL